jgi:hypothetical protein
MTSISVKAEDRLEGASNFNIWKVRVLNIFEENDLDSFVTSVVEEPNSNAGRENFKKNQAKAKRIIFYSVKDNIMPVIAPLKTAKECFDTLTNLYEKKAPSQKRVLKNRLRTLKMEKDDTVASFFTKISQIRDQLLVIGVPVDDDDLVQTVVDGLPPAWEVFLSGVNARETQPNFERLWHDCLQEEGRIQCRTGLLKRRQYCIDNQNKEREKIPFSKEILYSKGERQWWLQR